jgi:hypothetical protein
MMAAAHWIWVGSPLSSWSWVAMSGLHSLSATMTIAWCLPHLPLPMRMRRASIFSFLFILCAYVIFPVQRQVVLPIQMRGTTIFINTYRSVQKLNRGDWTAYQALQGQAGFARILALPGETIKFHSDSFEVNGIFYQQVGKEMPIDGETIVPLDAYYIWPDFDRFYHGGDEATRWLSYWAIVKFHQVIGTSYGHWLWHRQDFEPLVILKRLDHPATRP